MIDNFEQIQNFIQGKAGIGEFYFLQILKRRKDNPDLDKDMILIDSFFIKGAVDLEKKKDRIIEICKANNARAYFRLNKRSEKKVALQTLRLVAENIASENYKIKNCYLSCCGQFHSDTDKTWIVDIDGFDVSKLGQSLTAHAIVQKVEELQKETGKEPLMEIIPTKNGVHIITRPFNLKTFKDMYSDVDVHKDNPTILYIP